MLWSDIRKKYPNQWLVVEALEAHTSNDYRRNLDNLLVIQCCLDSISALHAYRQLHQEYPRREFYFFHTDRENIEVLERSWVGIRGTYEHYPSR